MVGWGGILEPAGEGDAVREMDAGAGWVVEVTVVPLMVLALLPATLGSGASLRRLKLWR